MKKNWLKEKAKKKKEAKSQHAFERKWPLVFFGKSTGQDIKYFWKEKMCAPEGWMQWRFFPKPWMDSDVCVSWWESIV